MIEGQIQQLAILPVAGGLMILDVPSDPSHSTFYDSVKLLSACS